MILEKLTFVKKNDTFVKKFDTFVKKFIENSKKNYIFVIGIFGSK